MAPPLFQPLQEAWLDLRHISGPFILYVYIILVSHMIEWGSVENYWPGIEAS